MANISDFIAGGGGGTLEELSDTQIIAAKTHQRLTYSGNFWVNELGNLFTTNRFGDIVEIPTNDDGTLGTGIIRNRVFRSEISTSLNRIETGQTLTLTFSNIGPDPDTDTPPNNPIAYRVTRNNTITGVTDIVTEGDITSLSDIPTTVTDTRLPAQGGVYEYNLEIDDDNASFPGVGYSQSGGVRGVGVVWFTTPTVALTTTAVNAAQGAFDITATVTDPDQLDDHEFQWAVRPLNSAPTVPFANIDGETNNVLRVMADGDYQVTVRDITQETAVAFEGINVNETPTTMVAAGPNPLINSTEAFTLTVIDLDHDITSFTFERALLTNGNPGVFTPLLTQNTPTDGPAALAAWNADPAQPYMFNVTHPATEGQYRYRLRATDSTGLEGTGQHDSNVIDQTTITVTFTDNTGANASLSNSANEVVMGVPGSQFSFSRTVNRVAPFELTGATCSEGAGDTDNNIQCNVSGTGATTRTLTFTGTYPTSNRTVNFTISASTQRPISSAVSISFSNRLIQRVPQRAGGTAGTLPRTDGTYTVTNNTGQAVTLAVYAGAYDGTRPQDTGFNGIRRGGIFRTFGGGTTRGSYTAELRYFLPTRVGTSQIGLEVLPPAGFSGSLMVPVISYTQF